LLNIVGTPPAENIHPLVKVFGVLLMRNGEEYYKLQRNERNHPKRYLRNKKKSINLFIGLVQIKEQYWQKKEKIKSLGCGF
jgi:hypothetical protein